MTDLLQRLAAGDDPGSLAAWPDDAADLARRHRESMFPSVGLFYEEPIELRQGEGQYVYDGAGRQYLDFFGGIATVASGHAIPEINDAIKAQLDRIAHTSTLFLIRAQIELAERLRAMTPPHLNKVFFCNSGTEANEAAIKFARKHARVAAGVDPYDANATAPTEIVSFTNCFHGRTMVRRCCCCCCCCCLGAGLLLGAAEFW